MLFYKCRFLCVVCCLWFVVCCVWLVFRRLLVGVRRLAFVVDVFISCLLCVCFVRFVDWWWLFVVCFCGLVFVRCLMLGVVCLGCCLLFGVCLFCWVCACVLCGLCFFARCLLLCFLGYV